MKLTTAWEIKKLDDICDNLDSKRVPITKSKRVSGDIPYYGASGVVDYVADHIFDEDLLLVSEDGANLLARTYPIAFSISGKTWVNNHAHVLRFAEKATQRFVEYYLNSISLEPYVSGMAQPKLNQRSLNSLPIPVPPIAEQKQIVAILDEAFEGIDSAISNTEKNLVNARELFESYLNAIFTRKGDDWTRCKIEEVCESIIDCINKTAPKIDESSPFKMIRTTNIRNGHINLYSVKYVTEETYRKWTRRQVPQKGDVLLTREAPMGEVGMICTDDQVFLGQRIVSYRVDSSQLNNYFLLYALQSKDVQNQIQSFASGSTVQHMRVPDTKELRISVPSLPVQEKVVKDLDYLLAQTQRLEAIYQQKLAALNELKQSILQKAFAGELTAKMGGAAVAGAGVMEAA